MSILALEGMTVLAEVEVIPPAEDWNWVPAAASLDEVIERLSATKTPFTSKGTGIAGIDHGEMY